MRATTLVRGAVLALALLLSLITGQEARADLFDLNSANIAFPGGAPYATVEITAPAGTSGEIDFTVTAVAAGAKIGELFFNFQAPAGVSLSGSTYSAFGNGTTEFITNQALRTNGIPNNAGGFYRALGGTSNGDRFHSITYKLKVPTSLTLSNFEVANGSGNKFEAHYYPSAGSTGYVYGGTPDIHLTSVTPEPSSMAIVVVGGLAFVGYGLRSRRRIPKA